ncbi:MAG TPA: hypothetical protein VIA11_19410 [Acidimicrobiia bacterium]|jgi:hypothetical protein|nr:hypothetical protein [Acidimicrobiia bacterium]
MQRSWREHLDTIRQRVDERKATHDLESAQRSADSAEEDAAFAIDYAYGAVEEAEYAVLDAILARMDADELAAGAKTGASACGAPSAEIETTGRTSRALVLWGRSLVSRVLARHCEAASADAIDRLQLT